MDINGAIFLELGEEAKVREVLDKFQEKTGRTMNVELSTFDCGGFYDEKYQGKPTGFIINGNKFRKQPVVETWEDYMNRIKAYLMDLLLY